MSKRSNNVPRMEKPEQFEIRGSQQYVKGGRHYAK